MNLSPVQSWLDTSSASASLGGHFHSTAAGRKYAKISRRLLRDLEWSFVGLSWPFLGQILESDEPPLCCCLGQVSTLLRLLDEHKQLVAAWQSWKGSILGARQAISGDAAATPAVFCQTSPRNLPQLFMRWLTSTPTPWNFAWGYWYAFTLGILTTAPWPGYTNFDQFPDRCGFALKCQSERRQS